MINDLIKPGDTLSFTKDLFITDYYDKENDSPFDVMILTDPQYGAFLFDNKIVGKNFIFKLSEVSKLKYVRLSSNEYTEEINFKTGDNNPNKLYSNMATMTISVNEYINLPPDQIGDNEITTDYGVTIVFTSDDFTTNTTPPYEDPENDGPYKLKVKSLPASGLLKLNGINVTVNQEILFTDIDNGLLTYVPANNTAGYEADFDFDISDLGSEQFSGL